MDLNDSFMAQVPPWAQVTPEAATERLRAIMRLAECPTCFCRLEPTDVKQCYSGHAVCGRCQEKLSSCPMCRAKFSTIKPLLFCQVLESLPRFCKNPGCKTLLQTGENHEEKCAFRPVTCGVNDCGTVVPADRELFVHHLVEKHNLSPFNQKGAVDLYFKDLSVLTESLQTIHEVCKYAPDMDFYVLSYQYLKNEKLLRVVLCLLVKNDGSFHDNIRGTIRLSDDNKSVDFKLSGGVGPLELSTSPSLFRHVPLGIILEVPDTILHNLKELKGLNVTTTIKKLTNKND